MQGETAWWRQHCHYWPVAVAGRELHATGPVESHRSVSNFRRADDSRISTQTACLASTPAKQGLRFSGSWHVMTILIYVNPFYNAHTSTNTVKSTLAGNSSGIFFKMQMCTAVRCSESCSKCAADRRNQKVETPQASPGYSIIFLAWVRSDSAHLQGIQLIKLEILSESEILSLQLLVLVVPVHSQTWWRLIWFGFNWGYIKLLVFTVWNSVFGDSNHSNAIQFGGVVESHAV